MQQGTAQRWKRRAMHMAFAKAHAKGAGDAMDTPRLSDETRPDHSDSGFTDGAALPAWKAPTRLPSALSEAAGKIEWELIQQRPVPSRERTVSLASWLIKLPPVQS